METAVVIGPIPMRDWRLLAMLRRSLDYYEDNLYKLQEYRKPYEMEAKIYKDCLGKYKP